MVLYIMYGNGHSLFKQAILFEFVRVHQRANQAAIGIFVWSLICFDGRCVWRLRGEGPRFVGRRCRGRTRVWFAGFDGPLASLRGSLLLSWREGAVELTIDEEVG